MLTVETKGLSSKTDERGLFGVFCNVPKGQSLRPPRRLYDIRPITLWTVPGLMHPHTLITTIRATHGPSVVDDDRCLMPFVSSAWIPPRLLLLPGQALVPKLRITPTFCDPSTKTSLPSQVSLFDPLFSLRHGYMSLCHP